MLTWRDIGMRNWAAAAEEDVARKTTKEDLKLMSTVGWNPGGEGIASRKAVICGSCEQLWPGEQGQKNKHLQICDCKELTYNSHEAAYMWKFL